MGSFKIFVSRKELSLSLEIQLDLFGILLAFVVTTLFWLSWPRCSTSLRMTMMPPFEQIAMILAYLRLYYHYRPPKNHWNRTLPRLHSSWEAVCTFLCSKIWVFWGAYMVYLLTEVGDSHCQASSLPWNRVQFTFTSSLSSPSCVWKDGFPPIYTTCDIFAAFTFINTPVQRNRS